MQDTGKKKDGIEGEGSYSGTRDYNERTADFIKKGKVDKAAQEAKRAVDSGEDAELSGRQELGVGDKDRRGARSRSCAPRSRPPRTTASAGAGRLPGQPRRRPTC